MVDPVSPNKSLAQPTSGTDVGTWDTPMNGNMSIIDNSFSGLATIPVSSQAVTLSSAQYQCVFLQFTGQLLANIAVTLPAIGSFYTIINDATNSSAFYITVATTAAGGRVIGLPPGTMTDIMTDGVHARFRGLPHIGSYWDHAGSSTPAWVSACTIPPWLYCNGTTFSSATYPGLASLFGSTTLPDFRGRMGFNVNNGTGRITSSQGGVDGNTLFAAGGAQTTAMSSQHMPNISFPVTDPGHTHGVSHNAISGGQVWSGASNTISDEIHATITVNSNVTGVQVNSGGSNTPFAVVPPSIVGGIRLVRAG